MISFKLIYSASHPNWINFPWRLVWKGSKSWPLASTAKAKSIGLPPWRWMIKDLKFKTNLLEISHKVKLLKKRLFKWWSFLIRVFTLSTCGEKACIRHGSLANNTSSRRLCPSKLKGFIIIAMAKQSKDFAVLRISIAPASSEP